MGRAARRRQATARGRRATILAVLVALVAACAGPASPPVASPAGTAGPASPPPASPAATSSGPGSTPVHGTLPAFRHVYVIVLENQDYGSIIGSPAAPYLNSLAAGYASLGQMYAEAHPSQPNYIALFSGSTQGVTDDGAHDLDAPDLADQLDAHGRTWAVFAQNVPPGCYTGAQAAGGRDGPGLYARKHEPAIDFADIRGDPARCARIGDLTAFDPAAADFELIIPNLCNDMHDCSVSTGDPFLARFVPRITAAPSFADSVLFITFDEGTSAANGGGHIATLVVSPLVRPGSRDDARHDHYSLLRTIEDAWDLGCLAHSCEASDLSALFGR